MSAGGERGTILVVGLLLLTVVTLLGLAGAGGAHVERQLARNEQFRENAASAASAGIEVALSGIVMSPLYDNGPRSVAASLPGSTDRFETVTRLMGIEPALPNIAGTPLAGAHFEITSTGYSAARAIDRQRAQIMIVVAAPEGTEARVCAPETGVPCFREGELVRLSWQRLAP